MKNLILFLAVILTGCTSNPDIGSLTSKQREFLSTLEIYKSNPPIENGKYKIIGEVKGLSCHRNAYKSMQILSEDEAMQGVKMNAAKLHADAVINTFCQTNSGTDWVNNCFASIVCAGDAIKYL